jgi:membrane protein DedA with SNARE-associated domain
VPLVVASACGFWLGDLIWYFIGRIQGRRVLGLLCRLSLNPDACVGRAERRFRRRPALTVAAAKFIPGLSLMVAPLAGILRMPAVQFAAVDGAASVAWSAAAVMSGVLFGRRVLPHVTRAQRAVEVLAGAAVVVFVAWKLHERRWLVRDYSVARVEIAELQRLLASERPEVLVIDLRSEQAFSGSAQMVPDGDLNGLPIVDDLQLPIRAALDSSRPRLGAVLMWRPTPRSGPRPQPDLSPQSDASRTRQKNGAFKSIEEQLILGAFNAPSTAARSQEGSTSASR